MYFSISSFPDYGRLARLDRDALVQGARVTHDEYSKEHASDFALWKAWTDADGDTWWDSPWGKGRPGWHLECSVMAREFLGDTIDIHMGGEDLVFPHHENEIAQSEAATGKPFVRYWLHNGYLLVNGTKMSKSAGNFYTLRDILAQGYSGREVRYLLLSVHYRQPLNFTFEGLHAARSALQRLDDTRARLADVIGDGVDDSPSAEWADTLETARALWREALDDDFNTSPALGALFDAVREMNRRLDGGMSAADAAAARGFLDEADTVLAVAPAGDEDVPAEVRALVEERTEARKAKDFSRADAARDALKEKGYTVDDTPDGPRVKRI